MKPGKLGLLAVMVVGLSGMVNQAWAGTEAIVPVGGYILISNPSGVPANEFTYKIDFKLLAGFSLTGANNGDNFALNLPNGQFDPGATNSGVNSKVTQPNSGNWVVSVDNGAGFNGDGPPVNAPNVDFLLSSGSISAGASDLDLGFFEFVTTQKLTGNITGEERYGNFGPSGTTSTGTGTSGNSPIAAFGAAVPAPLPAAVWMGSAMLIGMGSLSLFRKRSRMA